MHKQLLRLGIDGAFTARRSLCIMASRRRCNLRHLRSLCRPNKLPSLVVADPLIMDNGRDILDMICSSYESPEDADEDEHFNFSAPIFTICFCHAYLIWLTGAVLCCAVPQRLCLLAFADVSPC